MISQKHYHKHSRPYPTPSPISRAEPPFPASQDSWFHRNPKKTIALTLLVIILVLDWLTGLIFIPKNYNSFRVPHPYFHHHLKSNYQDTAQWGGIQYPIFTNSLGFRDSAVRNISKLQDRQRILLIGDSFTEGVGVSYEQTFAGLLTQSLAAQHIEVLNAAVVSYSPKLYYLKIKHLIETQHLGFDRLLVFIDISDIQNEISYRDFQPRPFQLPAMLAYQCKRFMKQHSFFYYSLDQLFHAGDDALTAGAVEDGIFPCFANTDKNMRANRLFQDSCSRWTFDELVFKAYGQSGLTLALENMQRLAHLCQQNHIPMIIAVYPWPDQIFYRDLDSIQVKTWQQFAFQNRITLINLFPAFIDDRSAKDVYAQYFFEKDVHWNAEGHRLVAEKVLPYLQ